MVGTEARRVETEEANDARLESLRPREMPERFLSRRPISTSIQRSKQQHNYGHRKGGFGTGAGRNAAQMSNRALQITNTGQDSLGERILSGRGSRLEENALISN